MVKLRHQTIITINNEYQKNRLFTHLYPLEITLTFLQGIAGQICKLFWSGFDKVHTGTFV